MTSENTTINGKHKIASIIFPIIAAVVILLGEIEWLVIAAFAYFMGMAFIRSLPYGQFKLIASIVFALCSLAFLPYLIGFISLFVAFIIDGFTGGGGLHP